MQRSGSDNSDPLDRILKFSEKSAKVCRNKMIKNPQKIIEKCTALFCHYQHIEFSLPVDVLTTAASYSHYQSVGPSPAVAVLTTRGQDPHYLALAAPGRLLPPSLAAAVRLTPRRRSTRACALSLPAPTRTHPDTLRPSSRPRFRPVIPILR